MSKIYSKDVVRIPKSPRNRDLFILKALAEVFYTGYETLSSEQMKPITKVIMENVRTLTGEKLSMSFAKK